MEKDRRTEKRADPRKGSRLLAIIIAFLIVLFFAIELFIREGQELPPASVTSLLLSLLQIIVLLLFLILLFVFGRNLIKLHMERKRKVLGSHFKTKLVLFFIALSLIPTLLLFLFASDLISRNIEQWFKTPLDKIMFDTKSLAEGFRASTEEITRHHARQLSRAVEKRKLIGPENRTLLLEFMREKLNEYKLDEISVYLNHEEQFSYLNAFLPLDNYKELDRNKVIRLQAGETVSSLDPMGSGEMIRSGICFAVPDVGLALIVAGKFIPQNYAQRIWNINSYAERYNQLKEQKNPVKTFYLITLIFITLLIIFAASWIGFHLARAITVPIEKLAHATKEVSRGSYDVRVEDPASDELGILIESFNQMVSDLKESHLHIAQKTSELEARKQHIETILNNITAGVITIDARHLITTINPSAREMLSLPGKNLIGKSYAEVLRFPRYGEICRNIELGIQNQFQLYSKEITIEFENQTRTLALTLLPLTPSSDRFSGLIVVLDNLTQLIRAQKIAAWKEVAQRVAHEIKNPLTPIQLSAERILKNIRKNKKLYDPVISEGAATIVQEARAIKALIDEFSNLARMPKIQLQPSNIHTIIQQTASLFKGIFPDIEFDLRLSPAVPSFIQIDPEQMKRVFINILDNAACAMNKKGMIRIQTSFNHEKRTLGIEVADSGPGISLKAKDRLFLPHFSTKKKESGLGLAIVHKIISDHNGRIKVENNHPHGAKFIVRIPAG